MYAKGQELSSASISFKIFSVKWVFKLSRVCEGSQNYNFAISSKIHRDGLACLLPHSVLLQENAFYLQGKIVKTCLVPLGFFFQFLNIIYRLKVEWIACDELCNMLYIILQRTCDIILNGHYLVCHLGTGIFTDHI